MGEVYTTADVFSPKERLLRVLHKQGADRPPVISPGGMINAALTEIMQKTGHVLPDAHHDHSLMSLLSHDVSEETGFENLGLPFCMTIEAEALGSEVDLGSITTEAKIDREPFPTVKQAEYLPAGAILKNQRAQTLIQSVYYLDRQYPDIPVIGSITGPLSLGGSLVDPMGFLKELRKFPVESHRLLDYLTEQLISFAKALADNGVSAICIADPTATGEILGPKIFEEFTVPYINRIVDAIHEMNVPVILHICGDVKMVKHLFPAFKADAISVDAMVSLRKIKEEFPGLITMGNLSTYMLEAGDEGKIHKGALQLLDYGIDIPAPACGLSTGTPISHVKAFTDTIKTR